MNTARVAATTQHEERRRVAGETDFAAAPGTVGQMLLLIIFACVVGYVVLAFAVLVAVTGELLDLVWPGSHSDQWDADLAMIEPPRPRTRC